MTSDTSYTLHKQEPVISHFAFFFRSAKNIIVFIGLQNDDRS